ncbi:MAG: hypothetical protein APF76_07805 [Desulfitibacter sp. BRH_c19]|nr:MAG: hypothetical protein APF76_07805 [Desulfitibacter sp. BRH_c19]
MSFYDLGFLFLIIGVILFYNRFTKYKKNRQMEMFASLGKKEQELLENLEEKGYKIKKINPDISVIIEEDYKTYSDNFRFPFIVNKNKNDYLVKMRKEKESIRISSSRYRKGLLTECSIFNVQGIVVADTTGKLREFNINLPKKRLLPKLILISIITFSAGFYIALRIFEYLSQGVK